MLPPEDKVVVVSIEITGSSKKANMQIANYIAGEVSIEFCYCSVYGNCWYRGKGEAPTKNPACESYLDY